MWGVESNYCKAIISFLGIISINRVGRKWIPPYTTELSETEPFCHVWRLAVVPCGQFRAIASNLNVVVIIGQRLYMAVRNNRVALYLAKIT